jgi:hypothetical protein
MFLHHRDDTPARFNIGPNGSLVTAGGGVQDALQPSPAFASSSTVLNGFPQVQETILFSPDNATVVSSQEVQVRYFILSILQGSKFAIFAIFRHLLRPPALPKSNHQLQPQEPVLL